MKRRLAVIGAGAGGASAAVDLSLAGHSVRLWARSAATLAPFVAGGGIEYDGVLGRGKVQPELMTAEIAQAVAGVDAVVVCLPTPGHGTVARMLAESPLPGAVPIVLNPGHTGGALEFANTFRGIRSDLPPVAAFSTLTYVARKNRPGQVTTSGKAKRLRVAALPGGNDAIDCAQALFSCAVRARDMLESDLSNVNMVLHPPGAVLGAAWIEARKGDYTFYVEGMTVGVARVMQALDAERRLVARAFGHELPPLVAEMRAIGTVEESVTDVNDLAGAIAGGAANRRIKAPDSLAHRYYVEDFGYGLVPFLAYARAAGVDVPVARSLLRLGAILTGRDFENAGRTAERMGIAGLDAEQLLARLRCP